MPDLQHRKCRLLHSQFGAPAIVRDHHFTAVPGTADPQEPTIIIDSGRFSSVGSTPRDGHLRHLHSVHRPARPRPARTRPALTGREIEVLVAWLRAESKQEAAESLFISASTVSTHIARIRAKYDAVGRPATTKSALFARAIQDGYAALDDW